MNPHPQALEKLRRMSYREARRWLRELGCTRSEQGRLIRRAKQLNKEHREEEPTNRQVSAEPDS